MNRYKPILAGVFMVVTVCSIILYIRSPMVQARSMLVNTVGEDYFRSFMKLKGVQYTSFLPPKSTVVYDYHIQVGNYSTTCEVIFIFDWINRLRHSIGVPLSDNLMPFNVSKEEAINIALEQITQRYLEVEAEIRFIKRSVNDVPLNKYVWQVVFYLTKKSASSGSMVEVLIDLHNGEVFDVAKLAWAST
ncbi:MAG: PepSY domain-containing protein [Candidatus Aminicenantes bacterium]|nr:PepSY domain-containing protein [Candidatus Aminicenantes bacterium]